MPSFADRLFSDYCSRSRTRTDQLASYSKLPLRRALRAARSKILNLQNYPKYRIIPPLIVACETTIARRNSTWKTGAPLSPFLAKANCDSSVQNIAAATPPQSWRSIRLSRIKALRGREKWKW